MDVPVIRHGINKEVYEKSIETMKISEGTLDYLRKKEYKTIEDVIDNQDKIPPKHRAKINAYLIMGIET